MSCLSNAASHLTRPHFKLIERTSLLKYCHGQLCTCMQTYIQKYLKHLTEKEKTQNDGTCKHQTDVCHVNGLHWKKSRHKWLSIGTGQFQCQRVSVKKAALTPVWTASIQPPSCSCKKFLCVLSYYCWIHLLWRSNNIVAFTIFIMVVKTYFRLDSASEILNTLVQFTVSSLPSSRPLVLNRMQRAAWHSYWWCLSFHQTLQRSRGFLLLDDGTMHLTTRG